MLGPRTEGANLRGLTSHLVHTGHDQMTRMMPMTTASVSELKAKLSAYLREVRRGGEVQVTDRGVPIARLVPLPPEHDADDSTSNQLRQRQIVAGVLRPGTGIDLSVAPLPTDLDLGGALADDRTDRL